MPEERYFEHHVFEGLERQLGRLIVFKEIFFLGFLMVFKPELAFVVGVCLQLGLHHIIGAEGRLT
jgi:hypothetical protein